MIDAHCHLSHLLPLLSLEAIIARAKSVGIERIVTCSCSTKDWDSEITGNEFIVPQFGVHPWWAAEERPSDWVERLRTKLIQFPSSGVGEIGLDKNKAKKGIVSLPVQIDTFRAQLKLACEMRRTCTIHCVNAYGTLTEILREEQKNFSMPVVIHSFSGSGDNVRELMRVCPDIYFSVSGHCPKETIIPFIPVERMLIETDSPSMPMNSTNLSVDGVHVPPQLDSNTNDCSQLLHVAARVASATGRTVSEVRKFTMENTLRAYQLR
jgi:TatD DNase family protein